MLKFIPNSRSEALAENSQTSGVKLAVTFPIVDLVLRFTVTADVTSALTLREDGIRRFIKNIRVQLGSQDLVQLGVDSEMSAGKILYYCNQLWYGTAPEITEMGTTVASHTATFDVRIPFALPPAMSDRADSVQRFMGSLYPRDDAYVYVETGSISDIYSAGDADFTSGSVEVVSVVETDAMAVKNALFNDYGRDVINTLATQNISLTSGAAVTDQTHDVDRIGSLYHSIMITDSSNARNDSLFTRHKLIRNTSDSLIDASVGALRNNAKLISGLGTMPTGVNAFIFDGHQNGLGAVDVGNTRETVLLQLLTSHSSLTTGKMVLNHYRAREYELRQGD